MAAVVAGPVLDLDAVAALGERQREARSEFHPGPVFANVVLVDEINRASPKTQSGLLECMQERHVTVDGHQLRKRWRALRAVPPGGPAERS